MMSRCEYASSHEARMTISSVAPNMLYAMSSSEIGGSSGPRRSAVKSRVGPLVMSRRASCTAARVSRVLLQGLGARQAEQVGAQTLQAQVAVHAHEQADRRVGFIGEGRLDELARPADEDVERLDEELALGGEVRVEHGRRDAGFPDDVADARALVAAAGELQRRGAQDRVSGLPVALRYEVGLRGLALLDQRTDAPVDLVERDVLELEAADLAQRLDVHVAVDRPARRRLLGGRKQTLPDVVVDRTPRSGRRALQLGDRQGSDGGPRADVVRLVTVGMDSQATVSRQAPR